LSHPPEVHRALGSLDVQFVATVIDIDVAVTRFKRKRPRRTARPGTNPGENRI